MGALDNSTTSQASTSTKASTLTRIPTASKTFTKTRGDSKTSGSTSSSMPTTAGQGAYQYWSERVYAAKSSHSTPTRYKREGMKRATETKWSAAQILNELMRVPGCYDEGLITAPRPPVHIYGLKPEELEYRLYDIVAGSRFHKEQYTIGGQVKERRQKANSPILLMAVASYPGPGRGDDAPTPERDMWQSLVVQAAQKRWGKRLRGVYAHVDEQHYHLHLWVDDDGGPAKNLHWGHRQEREAAEQKVPRKAIKEAFLAGLEAAQQWFHETVGRPMGWERKAPKPKHLTRAAWKKQREAERARAEEEAREELAKLRAELEAEQQRQNRRAAELELWDSRLRQQAHEMAWEAEQRMEERPDPTPAPLPAPSPFKR